jgi:hypothetical protein
MKKIVEKLVEFFSQVISDENNVVAQVNLVPPELVANRLIQNRLSLLNLL